MPVKGLFKQPLKKLVNRLVHKNAGKAIPDVKRSLQGPLLADVVQDGKTYKRKPVKINNRLDLVQHEANAVEYINTKGTRKQGELDFIDERGETHYMNKADDNLQYTSRNTKSKNNAKLAKRREKDMEEQTLLPDADFYKGTPAGKEAHHIAGLDQWGYVFDGLERVDKLTLSALLEKEGIPMGNNPFNRADLSPKVHNQLHTWMASKGMKGRKKNALGKMPLEDRMEYVQQVIKEYRESMKKMYELVMIEKHGEVWLTNDEFAKSYNRVARPEVAIYERP